MAARKDEIDAIVKALVREMGSANAKRAIRTLIPGKPRSDILTIVSNEGIHHLPRELRRGTVLAASRGNLPIDDPKKLRTEYEKILKRVAKVLRSKTWSRIYLVPFGHSTLCMLLKLLVYRVTSIETTDLLYDGKGNYHDLQFNIRKLVADTR